MADKRAPKASAQRENRAGRARASVAAARKNRGKALLDSAKDRPKLEKKELVVYPIKLCPSDWSKFEAALSVVEQYLPAISRPIKDAAIRKLSHRAQRAILDFLEIPKIEKEQRRFSEKKKAISNVEKAAANLLTVLEKLHVEEQIVLEDVIECRLGGRIGLWELADDVRDLCSACNQLDNYLHDMETKGINSMGRSMGRPFDSLTRLYIIEMAAIYEIVTYKKALNETRAINSSDHQQYKGEFLGLVYDSLNKLSNKDKHMGLDALGELVRKTLVAQNQLQNVTTTVGLSQSHE